MHDDGMTARRLLLFFVILISLAPGARAADVTAYDLDLALDFSTQSISGEERLTLRAGAGPVVQLAARDLTIEGVWEGERALPFEHRDGVLRITLAPEAASRSIRILYSGSPKRGLRFSGDQAFTAFNTSSWMVCEDDPSAKATLRLGVVVPADIEVISGGVAERAEQLRDARTRYRFRMERAYSTYLYGFAAGRFHHAEAGPLKYASVTHEPEALGRIVRRTPEMAAFFEDLAGVPLPGPSYTQVFLPDAPPQEMTEMSIMSDRYGASVLDDPREDYLVAHELAHSWWGNLVTCRTWSDFWLNEGMATYMVAAWKQRFWGTEEYERELTMARLRYHAALAKNEGRPLVFTGWKEPGEMGGPVTYSKGALVLRLLRREIGDAAFRDGLRAYTRAAAGGSVVSDDLRIAMEKASGRDLKPFFAQWVYAPPPQLVAMHQIVRRGVEVTIEQRQPASWTFDVDIVVSTALQRSVRRVHVTQRKQTFAFALDEPLLSVAVDPEGLLPDPIAHERPVSMLRFQLSDDPALAVRVGAVRELERICSAAAKPADCVDADAALDRAAEGDRARFVRQLASQSLARLRAASAAP
jgi:aminopeptidase N